jgi:hypothetical protein
MMLSDQPPGHGVDDVPPERRQNTIRLFVIRDGRLVELERRERLAPRVVSEPAAPYSPPESPKRA